MSPADPEQSIRTFVGRERAIKMLSLRQGNAQIEPGSGYFSLHSIDF